MSSKKMFVFVKNLFIKYLKIGVYKAGKIWYTITIGVLCDKSKTAPPRTRIFGKEPVKG